VRPAAVTALAALNPGRRAVKALAAVAILVFVIAAFVAWHSQPRAEAVATPSTSAAMSVATIPPPTTPTASPSAPGSAIVVAVTGRVRHPGLVTLPNGARVADAIAAAGGALPNTDLSFVNLARRLADGELIVIGIQPSPGEATDPTGGATSAAGGGPAGPVDINTAGLTGLETLPGIGPALAQRIVDYRTQHGAFHRVDDLQNVPGIGPSKYADLKDLITV
jgi:competence protein ComEA